MTNQKSSKRIILLLIIIAAFLDVIDFSVVQIAVPTIQQEFAVSLAEVQWVIGIYGLMMAGFLMVSGRIGDIYGQKKLFIAGIALFTIASFTAGFAPSLLILIISRAVQGIGAAISSVTALAILTENFAEGEERNKALGIFIAVLSAGFAAGSIMGGVLTALFGWRSVMFINIPIGIVAVILSQKFITEDNGKTTHRHIDLPGAIFITIGLITLVYAFTNAASVGFFTMETAMPLAASLAILGVFFFIEHRSKAPLVPLPFLKRSTVLASNIISIFMAAATGGVVFILTIYLQETLKYSALDTGLAFLPAAAMFFFVGGWGSSRFVKKFGVKKVLIISSACVTLGAALLATISPETGYYGVLPGFLLWSLGASIGFPALSITALSGAQHGEEGLASGLISTSQRLGFPLGVAVMLTVASAFDANLGLTGFRYAFISGVVLGALGLILSFIVKVDESKMVHGHAAVP